MTELFKMNFSFAPLPITKKETLIHCWWECKLAQPLWKTMWEFLKKQEIELLYDSAILITGKVLVPQSSPILCNPMDWSPPGSSIHGISQTRMLDWVAISFSRGYSQSSDQTQVSCISGRFFTIWATREAPHHEYISREKLNKRYMPPNVHSSTISNSQDMEATQVSTNRWLD